MSHAYLEESMVEAQMGLRYPVRVDLGKLGELDFLKGYMRPEAAPLAPEMLGRHIDDGLVECIAAELRRLALGYTDTEEFNSTMDAIEDGMRAHPTLFAFEMSLPKGKTGVRPPLPSAKYLELARRHVRPGATRGPSVEEGCRFARVLLAPHMRVALWETDWDMERYVRVQAVDWLGSRDITELRYYFLASELSPPAWDTLKAICRYLVLRGEEDIPRELLMWNAWAEFGLRPRPAEAPVPRHRLRKLGYIRRDNEIRHTVDLLIQVGMPKTAACEAVANGTRLEPTKVGMPKTAGRQAVAERPPVALGTVRRICGKPYATFADRGVAAMKRLEPAYYEFLYGPGSDSPRAQALRTFLER